MCLDTVFEPMLNGAYAQIGLDIQNAFSMCHKFL